MDFLSTPDVGPVMFASLTFASFATAFIGVFTGTAGGVILLAIMAAVMPPAALIPVHTVIQLGSGVTRTMIMWPYVMRSMVLPFMAGTALGAAAGAKVFVSLPPSTLQIILATFIIIVTWLPKLGRIGAVRGRFLALRYAATFLAVFVSATGIMVAPFVASVAPDRRNYAATVGALMSLVHIAKMVAFGVIGFSIGRYAWLMVVMIIAGAIGNWLGEVALNHVTEQRFRLILQVVLSVLALNLLVNAFRSAGWV